MNLIKFVSKQAITRPIFYKNQNHVLVSRKSAVFYKLSNLIGLKHLHHGDHIIFVVVKIFINYILHIDGNAQL